MSAVNPSYEEFMTACMADGGDEATCKARWNAANNVDPKVPAPTQSSASTGSPAMGDAELLRKIEMLESRLELREKQLKQAIDVAQRANDAQAAKDEAEPKKLIDSILMDSKIGKDELKNKALSELQTIRFTLDKSLEQTFANIAADMNTRNRNKPQLTAGQWDGTKWVGGV